MIGGAVAGVLLAGSIIALGVTATAWIAFVLAVLVLVLGAVDYVRRH